MFCFICSKQCIKNISLRKTCCLFSSAFKKIIPNYTTPTFQEVGGVPQPVIFCRTSHGIALTITKLIDFYSQGIFTFLYASFMYLKASDNNYTGFILKVALSLLCKPEHID